jgi:hypothetical protein
VAAAQILDERVPGADHFGRAKLFETAHRPQSRLESSMIGLDRIIGVLLDDVACGRQHLIEYPRVGGRPVGGHLSSRSCAVFESAGEKAAGGLQIPLSEIRTSMT